MSSSSRRAEGCACGAGHRCNRSSRATSLFRLARPRIARTPCLLADVASRTPVGGSWRQTERETTTTTTEEVEMTHEERTARVRELREQLAAQAARDREL